MLSFNKRINGKTYYIRVFAGLAILYVIVVAFQLLAEKQSLVATILLIPYAK